MSALSTREVLLKAADMIEPEGAWAQKEYRKTNADGTVSRCLVCALSQVKQRDISPELRALGYRSVWLASLWNDHWARTQGDVVAALRAAAAKASA